MGEARRRRLNNLALTDQRMAAIAGVVRGVSLTLPGPGGLCLFRAVTGHAVLEALGFRPTLTAGGMIYRAGPHPVHDIVAFCGPQNLGCRHNGRFVGHIWNMVDGAVVDFSAGDWRSTEVLEVGTADSLPPVTWMVEPPAFYWAPSAELTPPEANKHTGTPALGRCWFTGWRGNDAPMVVESLLRFRHAPTFAPLIDNAVAAAKEMAA
jgi:hypothetical protein